MDQDAEWATRTAKEVGKRIASLRGRLSAKQLAEKCELLGFPSITRTVITKLENGRRESISTVELQVLAKALGVPPVLLLIPLGRAEHVEVTPGQIMDPWDAVLWFSGLTAWPELPTGSTSVVELYQVHAQIIARPLPTEAAAADALSQAQAAARDLLLANLRQVRAIMRERDLIPPTLPAEVALAIGEKAAIANG